MPLSKDELESEAMKLAKESERLVTEGLTESEKAERERLLFALMASLNPV